MTPVPPGRKLGRLALALVLAFALNAAYGSRLTIANARPNLSTTALLTACLFADCEMGAWLGFMVGMLEAAFAARFIGSFIVTRTLAGFLVGLLEERIFRDNIFVAAAAVFVGSLFIDACFFLFAPQPHVARWFTSSLMQAAFNCALALPLYLLIKRVILKVSH